MKRQAGSSRTPFLLCALAANILFQFSLAVASEPASAEQCISCEHVTISCDDQNYVLGLDCVLHIPAYACLVAGLSDGDTLDSGDVSDAIGELEDFGRNTSVGAAIDQCIAVHELVHAKHATRHSGGTLLACASEVGAYDKEINCLERAKQNAATKRDRADIERQQRHERAWRDFNLCLCSLHPNQWQDSAANVDYGGTWEETCNYCKEVANVDGPEADGYCSANNPANPVLLCGYPSESEMPIGSATLRSVL